MSKAQDYFPPKGTKFQWAPKVLNHSPWTCAISRQMHPNLYLFPLSVCANVDLIENTFVWTVTVAGFNHSRTTRSGKERTAADACFRAEAVGQAETNKSLPDWAITALTHGWRPP